MEDIGVAFDLGALGPGHLIVLLKDFLALLTDFSGSLVALVIL